MTYRAPGRALTFGNPLREPDSLRDRKEGFEQRIAQLFEFVTGCDRYLNGAASRDLPEVSELDLECDGAPANTGALTGLLDLVDDLSECITRGFVGEKISGKRVLGADRFPYPIGADGPLVGAARGPVIVRARFPEMLLQDGQALGP